MKLRPIRHSNEILATDWNFQWTKGPISILGVQITSNLQELQHINFEPKLKKFRQILNIWQSRDLTVMGKIQIIRSLAIPQFTYLVSVIPGPDEKLTKELNSSMFRFIWNGKPDKIKRKV